MSLFTAHFLFFLYYSKVSFLQVAMFKTATPSAPQKLATLGVIRYKDNGAEFCKKANALIFDGIFPISKSKLNQV